MYEHFVMLSVAVLTFLEITPNQQLIICYLAKCGWATVWVLLLCRPSSQVIYRHVKITIMWDNCSCRSHYMKDLVSGNRWVISEVFSQITFEWKKRYNLPDDNNFPEAKLLKPTTVLLYAYLTNVKWAINHASNHAKHHKTLTLRNCHSGSEKVTNCHGGGAVCSHHWTVSRVEPNGGMWCPSKWLSDGRVGLRQPSLVVSDLTGDKTAEEETCQGTACVQQRQQEAIGLCGSVNVCKREYADKVGKNSLTWKVLLTTKVFLGGDEHIKCTKHVCCSNNKELNNQRILSLLISLHSGTTLMGMLSTIKVRLHF